MALYAKLWTDILGDEKLLRAERRGARHLFVLPWLFAFAKKADDDGRLTVDGHAAEPIDIAYGIPCITPKQIERGMQELESIGVLARDTDGALRLAAWDRRSGYGRPSDQPEAVRGRVAKHRERKKRTDVTTGNDVTVTTGNEGEIELEIEQDIDLEREQSRNATRAELGGAGDDAETDKAVTASLRSALGDQWPDVRRFLESRKRDTRPAWIREMAKLVGPGSQFVASDLAGACSDALALEEPLQGPHAMRAFVAKRAAERVSASAAGAIPSPGRNATQDEAARIVSNIRRLIKHNGASRFITIAEVEKMGPRILAAYKAVGGAERFLMTDAKDVKFLPYEFARALGAQDGSESAGAVA